MSCWRKGLVLVVCCLLLALMVPEGRAGSRDYGGIGLQVVPVASGELVVLQVVKGSPAAKGGIRPGDLIVQVDDKALVGSDFSEIVSSWLWGPPGTSVTLKYMRPGVVGIKESVLTRAAMAPNPEPMPGVKLIEPGR